MFFKFTDFIMRNKYFLCLYIFFFCMPLVYAEMQKQQIEVTLYNPYFPDVGLEVKCDWSNKINNFKFHKFYILPGKSKIKISVPSSIRNCQIWTKLGKF